MLKLHVADLPKDARRTNVMTPPPLVGASPLEGNDSEDAVSSDVALQSVLDKDSRESSLPLLEDE